MNRRELFAAAGALAASPLLPDVHAGTSSRVIPGGLTFTYTFVPPVSDPILRERFSEFVRQLIAQRIAEYERSGLLAGRLDDVTIRGTVSV